MARIDPSRKVSINERNIAQLNRLSPGTLRNSTNSFKNHRKQKRVRRDTIRRRSIQQHFGQPTFDEEKGETKISMFENPLSILQATVEPIRNGRGAPFDEDHCTMSQPRSCGGRARPRATWRADRRGGAKMRELLRLYYAAHAPEE